jgi:hypothetical protein
VAEELRLEQRLGQPGTIDRHIFGAAPLRRPVNVVGKYVLPDAGFAGDQDLGVTGRRALGELEQFTHRGTGSDQSTRFSVSWRRSGPVFHGVSPCFMAVGSRHEVW